MTDSTQKKKPVGRNVHQHLHATRVQIGAPFCKIVGWYIIMPNISTPYHTTIPFLANYSADRLTYVHQKAHTVCSWQTYSLLKKKKHKSNPLVHQTSSGWIHYIPFKPWKLRKHISTTSMRQRMNYKWNEAFYSQSWPPVTYFLQQDCPSHNLPNSINNFDQELNTWADGDISH